MGRRFDPARVVKRSSVRSPDEELNLERTAVIRPSEDGRRNAVRPTNVRPDGNAHAEAAGFENDGHLSSESARRSQRRQFEADERIVPRGRGNHGCRDMRRIAHGPQVRAGRDRAAIAAVYDNFRAGGATNGNIAELRRSGTEVQRREACSPHQIEFSGEDGSFEEIATLTTFSAGSSTSRMPTWTSKTSPGGIEATRGRRSLQPHEG